MEKYQRKLLVLASPRSGTRFLTKCLRHAQVKVGHEHIKRHGAVTAFFAVEDVWYPGKHWTDDHGLDEQRQRRSDYEFEQVWHITRDPRHVIPSLASDQVPGALWCWQERHTGISVGLYPKLLRAMLFWVMWNRLIEANEKIDLFFRIEDIAAHWSDICARSGATKYLDAAPAVSLDYGTYETGPDRHRPVTWADMEVVDLEAAKRVREMAARYGYA